MFVLMAVFQLFGGMAWCETEAVGRSNLRNAERELSYTRLGGTEELLQAADELSTLDSPNVSRADRVLAQLDVYTLLAQYDKSYLKLAKQVWQEASQDSEVDSEACERALVLLRAVEGNIDSALDAADSLVEQNAGECDSWRLRADIRRMRAKGIGRSSGLESAEFKGEINKVIADRRVAVDLCPQAGLRTELAGDLYYARMLSESLSIYRALSVEYPERVEYWVAISNMTRKSGEWDETRRALSRILELAPERVEFLWGYADALERTGEVEEARRIRETYREIRVPELMEYQAQYQLLCERLRVKDIKGDVEALENTGDLRGAIREYEGIISELENVPVEPELARARDLLLRQLRAAVRELKAKED